jgi:hypothetical protein
MTAHRCQLLAAAAAALLAGPAIAACGSSSSTSGGHPTRAGAQQAALNFARCMRSHGLSGWPDPNSSGGFDKAKLRQLGYSQSEVRATGSACAHLLPNGGSGPQETAQQARTRFAAALSFATCMRDRGFPNFPDPTVHGELTPQMVTAAGIDLHQRALLQAGLACAPVSHGLITRADVERAVNGG